MRKRICGFLALAATALSLSACQLMPEEEVLPDLPLVQPQEKAEYTFGTIARGDLILSETVRCTYDLVNEETLSFSVGGVYIDAVYVSEGQYVHAGDLLATLDPGSLQEQVTTQQHKLNTLNLQKKQLRENLELELRRHDAIIADLERQLNSPDAQTAVIAQIIETQKQKREDTQIQYANKIQSVEDSIYLQQMSLKEKEAQLATRQLRAGISGIVTFVREVAEGQRSAKGQSFITISDWDSALFFVKGEMAEYFPVGTEAVITAGKNVLEAVTVDPAEHGIPAPEEGSQPMAYLKLKQPDPSLDDGDRGTIELILEQRLNVLYAPKDGVVVSDGEAFVYITDENGLRVRQLVTIGLECGDFIEIVDGLQEGDQIILD